MKRINQFTYSGNSKYFIQMVTFVVIVLVLICFGLAYSIYGVYTAKEDEFNIEEPFDKNAFSKPKGWKVGEMPKGWISTPPLKKDQLIIQKRHSEETEKASVLDKYNALKKMTFRLPSISKSKNSDPMIP